MGKQLTSPALDPQAGGREGAERNPDAASPSSEKPRNSSGSASAAANLLDLRQKLNFALECIEDLAGLCGDAEFRQKVKRVRQQGFRSGR